MLAETAYNKLENLEDWELEHSEQDIRNRPLVTTSGDTLGLIDDLLVDRSAERVAAVRLEDGRVCAVEALEIHPSKVIYRPAGEIEAYGVENVIQDDDSIQLIEEEVAIGKRAVVGDTIRVSTKVVSDVVSEDIALQNEEVVVAVNEVNEVVSPAKADALFKEQTIEATAVNEEAVVAKRAVVTEEIALGKTVDTDIETVTETVRKTVADIDETAAAAKAVVVDKD